MPNGFISTSWEITCCTRLGETFASKSLVFGEELWSLLIVSGSWLFELEDGISSSVVCSIVVSVPCWLTNNSESRRAFFALWRFDVRCGTGLYSFLFLVTEPRGRPLFLGLSSGTVAAAAAAALLVVAAISEWKQNMNANYWNIYANNYDVILAIDKKLEGPMMTLSDMHWIFKI